MLVEMMSEVWKDIHGYEGRYQVSNLGRVKSIIFPSGVKVLSNNLHSGGYLTVSLRKDRKTKPRYVHRLVLVAFKGLELNMNCNHKDSNRKNNNIENLEWCTSKENTEHARSKGRIDSRFLPKEIYCCNTHEVMDSSVLASRKYNVDASSIIKCCKGKKNHVKGYIFKYSSEIRSKKHANRIVKEVVANDMRLKYDHCR